MKDITLKSWYQELYIASTLPNKRAMSLNEVVMPAKPAVHAPCLPCIECLCARARCHPYSNAWVPFALTGPREACC